MSRKNSEIFPYGCIGSDTPERVLYVELYGAGDDSLRMGKRLKCAATALNVGMTIRWIKDSASAASAQIDGSVLLDKLVSTEAVENQLRDWLEKHPHQQG